MAVIHDDKEWEKMFVQATKDIHGRCSYSESASMLSKLVKTGLLRFTDLERNPARFFLAHRLLLSPNRIPEASGFGVRFTVEFNLFAGSILGLGSSEQVKLLDEFQSRGVLGCFCLTEVFAGVNSGLVVATTATWVKERQQFVIDSRSKGAEKNWISQGLTASHAVVIANLSVDGHFYGPHGFLVVIRDERTGALCSGVSVEDMGEKTVANDLDNARVSFSEMYVSKSALLGRFAEIRNDKYIQTTSEPMRIEILGQRLLTGRLAIAQASCLFCQRLFATTKEYTSQKKCWAPKGQPNLFLKDIPHIAAIFSECESKMNVLNRFNNTVEAKLNAVLSTRGVPDTKLVELIAVAKIKSVQTSITLVNKLAREVGSYALMHESGFGATPWLYMCQFAEGDSRILMQKLARDNMKRISKTSGKEELLVKFEDNEQCCRLALRNALSNNPTETSRLWNENWDLVYELAEAVCMKHIAREVNDCQNVLSARL